MRIGVRGTALAAALMSLGCNTMRFEVGSGEVSNVVEVRKAYFLFGLTPTREVDVRQYCPRGAVAIREQTTFVDGLLRVLTLAIYTPRTSWFYCSKGAAP